jgi:4-hydroxy-3-methylbut-2-enyl diphosphate reductase
LKLIVAQGAGFCSGVRKAVDLVYEHTDGDIKLYSIGPLIHNAQAIAEMEKKGLVVEESVDNIDNGEVVIIRSHGVPEVIYEKLKAKDIKVIDATCHFVKKIHRLVSEYSQKGYAIIIIGQKEHPEVVGIMGWCSQDVYVLDNPDQTEALPTLSKACVVAQTTITHELWGEMIKSLSSKIEHLQVFNTVCNTTAERQKEAQTIAKMVSVMFVVGGKDSSNTRKLFEICKAACPDTIAIETASEIDATKLGDDKVIGITAGASTPDWVINEVLEKLNSINQKAFEQSVPHTDEQPSFVEDEVNIGTENRTELESAAKPHADKGEKHQMDNRNEVDSRQTDQHSEDYNSMADFHKTMVVLRPDEIVKGTVISVSSNEIIVNLGYKSDGILSADEVSPDTFKPGDVGEFEIIKVNDGEGNVILSRKSIEKRLAWERIEKSLNEGIELDGVCVEAVKGGVVASIFGSIRAFIPASQLSTEFVSDLSYFVGKTLRLKVLEIDKRRNRIVASQRVVLEAEKAMRRNVILDSIVEGQTIKGTVMRLTDFGVFVDIGGVDGLIRMPDLSWRRIAHPREVLKEGQQVEVLVLSVNREKEKVSLGYKQANPHPWDGIETRFAVGDIVTGKVARIAPFGAFIELEPGVDGLVHISQISRERVISVEKALSAGQTITAKILKVDPKEKKISLSIKEADKHDDSIDQETVAD